MRNLLRSQVDVQLFSCGFNNLGLAPANKYTQGEFGDLVEKKINEKLNSDYGMHAVFDCCEGARDPNRTNLRGHWGENLHNLENFLKTAACTDVLKSVRDNIGLDDPSPRMICIACCCRSGRHRGVSMCAFLREILKRLGFNVLDTVHVNDDKWHYLCTGSKVDNCFHCSERSFALKKELFDRALDIFKSL